MIIDIYMKRFIDVYECTQLTYLFIKTELKPHCSNVPHIADSPVIYSPTFMGYLRYTFLRNAIEIVILIFDMKIDAIRILVLMFDLRFRYSLIDVFRLVRCKY